MTTPRLPEPPRSVADSIAPPGLWRTLNFLAGAAQFYHGYKRNNDSVAWGAVWAVAGAPTALLSYLVGLDSEESIFIASHAPPLGLAATQGFAKPLESPEVKSAPSA